MEETCDSIKLYIREQLEIFKTYKQALDLEVPEMVKTISPEMERFIKTPIQFKKFMLRTANMLRKT